MKTIINLINTTKSINGIIIKPSCISYKYIDNKNAIFNGALYDLIVDSSNNNTIIYKESIKDFLVGGYNKKIYKITPNEITNKYIIEMEYDNKNIQNVSWMLKLDNNIILLNDEYNSKLYFSDDFNKIINLTKLLSPVYFYEYKNIIYIACYGDSEGNKAGLVTITDDTDRMVSYYAISNSTTNHIHAIDLFTPTNNTISPFLIAVDLGDQKLYKIDPTNINFNHILHDFSNYSSKKTQPRHFIQIPDTNKIVVLTEEFETYLVLLEYDETNKLFTRIDTLDLKDMIKQSKFKDINIKDITGAEIKYYKKNIYISIRTYKDIYKDWTTDSNIGIFAKVELVKTSSAFSLKLINTWFVGINPRYFCINNNKAYVCNQQSNSITVIDINNMNDTLTTIDLSSEKISPAFIMPNNQIDSSCCSYIPVPTTTLS